ncbi:ABC transporter substrate-binding protein [Agromyces sp. Leaf222]|uniref:ABC transporter substrate-binding protein n=1 Tax=Agromyces sp. Leaf222 TaxID=1735688 RepID=UPI0006FBAD47|nr:extracellular solute-binding protein [Agromyces sp. Leaf222]KQM82508.1 sugar ABC transporter substrate-binding protein [Agromyces sp. Leaf222]
MSQHSSSRRRAARFLTVAAAATAGLLALSGCSADASGGGDSSLGFTQAEQVADSPITVWVDASREPAVTAFQAKYPDIEVNLETYDGNAGGSGSFQSKISLMDQAGEGWPDVVFSTQQNDAIWASKQTTTGEQGFAAPLNKGFIEQDFLDGFAQGSLDYTTIDGTVYGLRNDLAQTVFYSNQKLLDEFGYETPTTWEEYAELGDKLAAEHPGYILGSMGDSFMTYVYYGGSESPVFQSPEANVFHSDTSDANSEKISKIIDGMLANGTLVQDSFFSADFASKYADKLVGVPGPVWYTGAIFQGGLAVPAGEISVSAPLTWEGGDVAAGNVGGGVWYASSHSKNLDAVKTFLEFVTSADEFQVDASSGYPAYTEAAGKWLDKQAEAGYFVNDDFKTVMSDAAGQVWSGWNVTSWSPESAWAKIVIPGIADGKTIESLLPAWQEELENEATVNGYSVE